MCSAALTKGPSTGTAGKSAAHEKFRIYERIIQYDARRDGDFYHYIYLREEIDQLINLLMYLSGGCDGEYFYRYSDYLKKHCAYDLDRVVLARSF